MNNTDILISWAGGLGFTAVVAPFIVWLINGRSLPLGWWLRDPASSTVMWIGALVMLASVIVMLAVR